MYPFSIETLQYDEDITKPVATKYKGIDQNVVITEKDSVNYINETRPNVLMGSLVSTQSDTTTISITKDQNSHDYLALVDNPYKPNESANNKPTITKVESKSSSYDYKKDYLMQVYIGSLTVVGLFVVYRAIYRK